MSNYELMETAVTSLTQNNVVLLDDLGEPGVYVRIPKFTLGDVLTGGGSATHPAFIINGVEVDAIYVSKYQNIIQHGRAYSLPMRDPAAMVDFDAARAACEAKGEGYHLMTNAEWAAVALWVRKNIDPPNRRYPYGNDDYGKSAYESEAFAVPTLQSEGQTLRVATGSGGITWSHNWAEDGIWDLNGNVQEWVGGLRLVNGEIQVLANNDAADPFNSQAADSPQWKAILENGTLVEPGTALTLKYDYISAHGEAEGGAFFHLVKTLTYQQTTDAPFGWNGMTWLVAQGGVSIPALLLALGLMPESEAGYASGSVYMRNNGTRMATRGGDYTQQYRGGIHAFDLRNTREQTEEWLGFRSAYVVMP
jgi:hypothetical protein